MWIIYDIRRIVQYLYQVFADMALWCWAHDPPFGSIGSWFAQIYDHLTDLHYGLYLFAEDYESLWEGIIGIITESDVFSLLQSWLTFAEDAWYWVANAFNNVVSIIWEWWPIALGYVMTYVDNAVEGLVELREAWDTFWTVTLPSLISFDWLGIWWEGRIEDVQSLITTAVEDIENLMLGWQEVRDSVLEFFGDPYGWIYDRLDEFFERFW